MTSAEIRQSFLDFFREKQHTIVPSSSLMPDSPNLLFTNAGMNQFVPIFLGEQMRVPVQSRRAPPTRRSASAPAANTTTSMTSASTPITTRSSRCSATGRFGDYFKKEAIEWAWELVVERWKFPAEPPLRHGLPARHPGDPERIRPGSVRSFWAEHFRSAGLDPAVHIVNGNKKDNFWMMGETGPCGPCSELHVDLTPAGDTRGALVNKGTADCIEIWNLVFIQFNANPDGTFSRSPPSTSTPAWASSASPRSSRARRISPTSPTRRSPTTRPTSSARSSTRSKS